MDDESFGNHDRLRELPRRDVPRCKDQAERSPKNDRPVRDLPQSRNLLGHRCGCGRAPRADSTSDNPFAGEPDGGIGSHSGYRGICSCTSARSSNACADRARSSNACADRARSSNACADPARASNDAAKRELDGPATGTREACNGNAGKLRDLSQRGDGARQTGQAPDDRGLLRHVSPVHRLVAVHVCPHQCRAEHVRDLPQRGKRERQAFRPFREFAFL